MKKKGPELLMCSPEHYSIRYEINPWMKISRQIDPEKADHQWNSLYDILNGLVHKIHLMKPVSELPDMVFTANAGLPVKRRFFLSRFRYRQRSSEAEHFKKWFKERKFQVVELPQGIFFEGAGDALFLGNTLFAGYRYRSDIRAHSFIAETLGIQVLSLELVDKRFYHLDTCFAPLNRESALYFPGAFDRYAQKVIQENIPDPIRIPSREALRFVCNAVVIGRNVVIHAGCPRTGTMLADRGFKVHETDLSEYIKAGGSAKCLTLQIK